MSKPKIYIEDLPAELRGELGQELEAKTTIRFELPTGDVTVSLEDDVIAIRKVVKNIGDYQLQILPTSMNKIKIK